ncbi:hypothetical protein BDW59DRAFT_54079 [Aspergillus cavernicola]|uniref:Uncharacterized protein n=1 Tax=Aspergillus cavernicola TaxID=176166 RepID=A0ABR4H925_9EURO
MWLIFEGIHINQGQSICTFCLYSDLFSTHTNLLRWYSTATVLTFWETLLSSANGSCFGVILVRASRFRRVMLWTGSDAYIPGRLSPKASTRNPELPSVVPGTPIPAGGRSPTFHILDFIEIW